MQATVEAAIEVALGDLGAAQLKMHVTYEVCHLSVLESILYQTETPDQSNVIEQHCQTKRAH